MFSDEELYRQYLSGDETGLDSLMQKYGNSLTLYINGYLHDLHEAEDLMIDVFPICLRKSHPYGMADLRHICIRRHVIWRCGIKAGGNTPSA